MQLESSGPLPLPDILRGYNSIVPDAAERIFQMAESEQRTRHQATLELLDIKRQRVVHIKLSDMTGLWLGFVICAGAMVASTCFFLLGNNYAGCGFLLLPLVGIAQALRGPPTRGGNDEKQPPA